MPLLLVLLFIVVPIAELAVLIQVGQLIGVWWTILLLVADALIGSWLLKTQSRAAWRRFNEALEDGRVPHREVVDGVLVIFGGGPAGLAGLQRGGGGRPRPAPRGGRRRARDLRRRAAPPAGFHYGHLRGAVPVPAHARAAARAAGAARRAQARRRDARHREPAL